MAARKWSALVFLVLVPLAIFLLLGELALRLYLTRHIFYDVEMSRYAHLLKVDSPNPRIGHHHRPHAEAHLMGVTIRTNSDGFRDDEYPLEKDGRRRIIFLGDSLTLGWGVEQEDTFEHLLEARLDAISPTEIINLGVGNYNTTQEVQLLIDKGLKYRPDEVVLFYFINDAEPAPQKSRFPWLGNIRLATFYWSRIKALAARWSAAPSFQEYYSDLYRDGQSGWANTRVSLRELAQVCRSRGIELRVVLLPELHELRDYPFTREHAMVTAAVRKLGVPVLDLAPRFRDVDDPQALWVATDDAHPNARAHRMIAEYTFPFLAAPARGTPARGTPARGNPVRENPGRGNGS